jgi:hypothetical protein
MDGGTVMDKPVSKKDADSITYGSTGRAEVICAVGKHTVINVQRYISALEKWVGYRIKKDLEVRDLNEVICMLKTYRQLLRIHEDMVARFETNLSVSRKQE